MMIDSDPMKNLAVQMIHGALDNIQKGNKYAEHSRLFLSEYEDTWCAIVLDIPVDVISRGIDGVLSGSNTLGSLSGERAKKYKHHPLEGLTKDDVCHKGSVPLSDTSW